jgi:hypothetical protein
MTKEELFEDLKEKVRVLIPKIERSDVIFATHGKDVDDMLFKWALLFDHFPIEGDTWIEVRKIRKIDIEENFIFFTNHDTNYRFCVDLFKLAEKSGIDLSDFYEYAKRSRQ